MNGNPCYCIYDEPLPLVNQPCTRQPEALAEASVNGCLTSDFQRNSSGFGVAIGPTPKACSSKLVAVSRDAAAAVGAATPEILRAENPTELAR